MKLKYYQMHLSPFHDSSTLAWTADHSSCHTMCTFYLLPSRGIWNLKLLLMLLLYSRTKNNENMLHSLCTCIWMVMFITMALWPVSPICVSLLRMLYKWQSSYAYCISFVCFTRSNGLFKQNGEATAALRSWYGIYNDLFSLRSSYLLKAPVFTQDSKQTQTYRVSVTGTVMDAFYITTLYHLQRII